MRNRTGKLDNEDVALCFSEPPLLDTESESLAEADPVLLRLFLLPATSDNAPRLFCLLATSFRLACKNELVTEAGASATDTFSMMDWRLAAVALTAAGTTVLRLLGLHSVVLALTNAVLVALAKSSERVS
mmetsp:Transcript_9061/g.17308  ORF Transcript_9061/g.17308 Transcript_9061/m.17308 type:complete len:130 (+) Transcript_9061:615-1004(+)